MAWPTETEIGALLVSSGLVGTAPSDALITPYLENAIAEFERLAGWYPALIESVASSVTFHRDDIRRGNVLSLRTGYQTITGVLNGASALVLGTDYRTLPASAISRGRAITDIEFMPHVAIYPDVTVTGKRGRFVSIPADLFLALQQKVAANWVTDQMDAEAVAAQQLAKKIKQGPFEQEFAQSVSDAATGTLGGRVAAWSDAWDRVVMSYKRLVV